MLHIQVPSRLVRGLAVHHIWFAPRPVASDALRFAQYFHCGHRAEVPGFRRSPKFTLLVDLGPDAQALLHSFTPTTRYEVNRADRDGLRLEIEQDAGAYRGFLNAASATKGRGQVDAASVAPYWPHLRVTKAVAGGETLVMHAHLVDPQSARVLLYQSASLFRLEAGSQARNRIARANRWLHFRDMLMFRDQGLRVYDFGGIVPGTGDAEARGINEFKQGFGGAVAEQSNYVSHVNVLWNRLRGGTGAT